jgi:hypothetical protein
VKGKTCTLLCAFGGLNQIRLGRVAIDAAENRCTACFSFPLAPSTSGTNPEAKHPGNSIEDVPSSICNLVCLKSLSLNGNKIRQVYALVICCSITKLTKACHPTPTLYFSASGKHTERLHGSSEPIAA